MASPLFYSCIYSAPDIGFAFPLRSRTRNRLPLASARPQISLPFLEPASSFLLRSACPSHTHTHNPRAEQRFSGAHILSPLRTPQPHQPHQPPFPAPPASCHPSPFRCHHDHGTAGNLTPGLNCKLGRKCRAASPGPAQVGTLLQFTHLKTLEPPRACQVFPARPPEGQVGFPPRSRLVSALAVGFSTVPRRGLPLAQRASFSRCVFPGHCLLLSTLPRSES